MQSSRRRTNRRGADSSDSQADADEHGKTTSNGVLGWVPTPFKTVLTGIKRVWAPAEEPKLEAMDAPAFTGRAGLSLDEVVRRGDDDPNQGGNHAENRRLGNIDRDAGFGAGGRKAIETWGTFSRDLILENGLDAQIASTKPAFLQDQDTKKTLDNLRRIKRRTAPFHADPGPRKGLIDGLSFWSPTGSGSGGSGMDGSGGGFRGLPQSQKPELVEGANRRRVLEYGSGPFSKKVSEDMWEGKAISRVPLDKDARVKEEASVGKGKNRDWSLEGAMAVDISESPTPEDPPGSSNGCERLPLKRTNFGLRRPGEHLSSFHSRMPRAPASFKLGGRDFKTTEAKPYGNLVERLFGKPTSERMELVGQAEKSNGRKRKAEGSLSDVGNEGEFDLPVFKSGFGGEDAERMNGILKRLKAAYPDINGGEFDSEVTFVNQEVVVMLRNC